MAIKYIRDAAGRKLGRVPKTTRDASSKVDDTRYALSLHFRGEKYHFANRLGSKELAKRYLREGYKVRLMPYEEGGGFMIFTNPKPPYRGYQPSQTKRLQQAPKLPRRRTLRITPKTPRLRR